MLRTVARWLLAGILTMLAAQYLSGQDFAALAFQLTTKILERAPSASASLSVKNRSSLSAETAASIGAEVLRLLQSHGWKVAKPEQAESSLLITLSENPSVYLLTAEINKPGARDVVMVELPRPKESGAATTDRIALSRSLLISSATPILDATLLEGRISEGAHLLTLTPSAIQLYRLQAAQWRFVQSQALTLEPIASRDLRGRVSPGQGGSFDAFLPGVHCTGAVTTTLSANCRESDDPWPVGDDRRMLAFYAASRNYFTGVVSGAAAQNGNASPFYSAALLSDRTIYAGIDGRPRMNQNGGQPLMLSTRWGSNLATLQSSCQSELVLASGVGDFHQSDAIAAFRPSGTQFNAASEPMPFFGSVLDLKTSADHQQAIVVVFSPSGQYEAYSLTARCGA